MGFSGKLKMKAVIKLLDIKVLASGSKGNCYIIDDGSTKLMIECGIPISEIKKECGYKTHELAGCLISHEH